MKYTVLSEMAFSHKLHERSHVSHKQKYSLQFVYCVPSQLCLAVEFSFTDIFISVLISITIIYFTLLLFYKAYRHIVRMERGNGKKIEKEQRTAVT